MWQEHECLFDISNEMYHNRAEKEKRWTEIANALQQPGELTLNTVFKLGRGRPEVKILNGKFLYLKYSYIVYS